MTTQTLILAKRAIHTVADASAVEIACDRGALWVTLDNDPQDYVLEAGERLSSREHRTAMVYALQPAALRLTPRTESRPALRQPEPARPPVRGGWPGLRARLGV